MCGIMKLARKTSNRPPTSSTCKWDDNIELDVGDIWFQDVDLMQLAQKEGLMVALFNLHPTRVGI